MTGRLLQISAGSMSPPSKFLPPTASEFEAELSKRRRQGGEERRRAASTAMKGTPTHLKNLEPQQPQGLASSCVLRHQRSIASPVPIRCPEAEAGSNKSTMSQCQQNVEWQASLVRVTEAAMVEQPLRQPSHDKAEGKEAHTSSGGAKHWPPKEGRGSGHSVMHSTGGVGVKTWPL